MSRKHKQILAAIFSLPTHASIRFTEIEKLIVAFGGEIIEGHGSRVSFKLAGRKIFLHRPHPGKEAMKYQVEGVREFLLSTGVIDE
ncbi:MAG: type II toxin-antitoxin system HicA family toxin [Acidobacteria bacterium]|nr:type II toxin-antitoxin system HicA family toxin [Acidobacteriota bacterium]